jgi:hypothetical protein
MLEIPFNKIGNETIKNPKNVAIEIPELITMTQDDLESDDTPTKVTPKAFKNLQEEIKLSEGHSIMDSEMAMSYNDGEDRSQGMEDSMNRSSNMKSVTQGQNDEDQIENENKLNLNFMIDE